MPRSQYIQANNEFYILFPCQLHGTRDKNLNGKALGQGFLLTSIVCVSGAWAYGRKVQRYKYAFPNTLLVDYENEIKSRNNGTAAHSDRFELVCSLPQGSSLADKDETEVLSKFTKSLLQLIDPSDEEIDSMELVPGDTVAMFKLKKRVENEVVFEWADEGRTWFAIEPETSNLQGSEKAIRFCFGSSITLPEPKDTENWVRKGSNFLFSGLMQFHYLYSSVLLQNTVETLLKETDEKNRDHDGSQTKLLVIQLLYEMGDFSGGGAITRYIVRL
eukprot:scaffold12540_cov105-Cylindrotheca_fusiformis.AAC.3